MKRVNIILNKSNTKGQILPVPDINNQEEVDDFYCKLREYFHLFSIRIFALNGCEIIDLSVIRDNETVVVTGGRDFSIKNNENTLNSAVNTDIVFAKNIRCAFYLNGTSENGRIILLPNSLDELLKILSNNFKIKSERIFSDRGCEIVDINVIRDDEILYVSQGEDFIQLGCNISSKILTSLSKTDTNNADHDHLFDWITLNVGGRHFVTSRATLTTKEPLSMLARMFTEESGSYFMPPSSKDSQNAYLIDRSADYFEPILNYLRHGEIIMDKHINPKGVLEEAKFYGIESMIPLLEWMIKNEELDASDDTPLTRKDVVNCLVKTLTKSELRFQGVNLSGADLSRLDLRYINFKYACLSKCNLHGANLSHCCLERADLSFANLDGAQLLGIRAMCANMEGANLKNSNMEDPAGPRAILEGVNLKGANLDGSNLAGVNLRVATLKNANLQNCDLRGAVLAGADLQNCDLSGSDLHEANLRGANLKDAAFELMLTPLHMSQTVR